MTCLLPFKDGDGWENKATINAYEDYARFCFETYGDLVDQWITFNEPIVPVEFGYFYDAHYPHKVDAKQRLRLPYHTQLASTLAVKACHEVLPGSKIGIVLNLTPTYPRSQHPADVKAARIADLFQAQSFLDPSVLGAYPEELVEILSEHDLLPEYTAEELELIRENTVDFPGVNYYQPLACYGAAFLLSILTAHSCLSIFMNLTLCQVVRLIHTTVGKSTSKEFMTLPKTSRKTMGILVDVN